MDRVLTGDEGKGVSRVSVWSEERRVARQLPAQMPFDENETQQFRSWIARYLSDLSAQCAASKNAALESKREKWIRSWKLKNGSAQVPKRNLFPFVAPISYKSVDFKEVCASADRLWDFYFTEDGVCLDRWIVSIDKVLAILDDMQEKRYAKYVFDTKFTWTCTPEMRNSLRARLEAEKRDLIDRELWPDRIEDLKAKLAAAPSCTIDTMLSGESRILVMIAVFSRLMVHTAVAHASLWERRSDLFAFFTHILIASNRDFELPFPWHLDIMSGSYLRTGRTHARQANVVDGDFHDESERSVFIVFVAHYLAMQKDAKRVVDAILASPRMTAYFADNDPELAVRRVRFLKNHFGGIS